MSVALATSHAKNIWENTAFHLVCRKYQWRIAEMILNKSDEFKIDLNAKDDNGETAFILACKRDSVIVEVMIKKSSELSIDLHAKNIWGDTAFHVACRNKRIWIVEMMITNAETMKFDFTEA